MDTKHIRNFSIIAHIDHGKSTFADRMLEFTKTVEARKMREQVLDQMDLERERGITIKMQPVRMKHRVDDIEYVFNLIDTPGHIDFSYEVSRALKAVEGVILLVDATQGVQAQTLSTLQMAQDLGLVVIPALSKVDSPLARIEEVRAEIIELLQLEPTSVIETSGKTGQGVAEIITAIIAHVPPPTVVSTEPSALRALVFDYEYSTHQGIIVYARIFDGVIQKRDTAQFRVAEARFVVNEVGTFSPEKMPVSTLGPGEIGYFVTGIKKPGIVSVGDTIVQNGSAVRPLSGYQTVLPVVWASVYPESQDDFMLLTSALDRLKLTDSSLSYEEEQSGILGRGFRCGFLGMLHMEIVSERLKREFDLDLVVTSPSITYDVTKKGGEVVRVYTPAQFPEYGSYELVREPWILATIMAPQEQLGMLTQILYEHDGAIEETVSFGNNKISLAVSMPLRELMRNFFDELKSVTSGYASLSYDILSLRDADVARLDVMVGGDSIPAFSRIVARKRVEIEAKAVVEELYKILPRQQFVVKLQAMALGRIISSKTLSAFRKDVTAKLYGGDITRKMKLREKQKKGKKKMREHGKINIPQDVFMKMMKI